MRRRIVNRMVGLMAITVLVLCCLFALVTST